MTMSVTVRPATVDDFSGVAAVLAYSPDDGGKYIYPSAESACDAMLPLTKTWTAEFFQDTKQHIVVATAPSSDTPIGVIIFRIRTAKDTYTHRDVLTSPAIEEAAGATAPPHPGEPIASRSEIMKHCRSGSTSPRYITPSWELCALAVLPSHRRMGVASSLIKWGQERAQSQGIPIYVTGETSGIKTYMANGFQRIPDRTFYLDDEAKEVSATDEWTITVAESVWVPSGHSIDIRGKTYSG